MKVRYLASIMLGHTKDLAIKRGLDSKEVWVEIVFLLTIIVAFC